MLRIAKGSLFSGVLKLPRFKNLRNQFVNLSQKYALEQCLSHKSYNKKELRMAIRSGGGHNIKKACISHQIDETNRVLDLLYFAQNLLYFR